MSILIRDCNLFDSVRLETTRGVSILVKDDRVAEIFPGGRNTPPADRVLDAVGCTALPGLFNLHSHPQRRHARFMGPRSPFRVGAAAVESLPNTQRLLYAVQNCWVELIEEGITTIRAAGSKDLLNIELREVFAQGPFRGPRIVSTGPLLAITGGHGTRGLDGGMEVDGVDEVRKTVRAVLKAGADWIKLCVSGGLAGIHKGDHPTIVEFTLEEVRAAVEEAHKRRRKVMVHGMAAESVKMAVEAGVDCIEHGNLLDAEAIAMMAERGVSYVPTMSGIRKVYERERDGGSPNIAQRLYEVIAPQAETVAACIRAGILIGTGTDTLGSLHREIALLVECGMTHAQALSAATYRSAQILGMEREIGSIEEGKIADLLVIDGDPLSDLGALGRIREVMSQGRLVTWQCLAGSTVGREE
ncbi:MAG: amidohydrolase family protein [Candidatus Bipolaricaulis sp.]|nr:amidohydrolase family protein [Candidatus Bipolaricaulis sp.]